MCLLRRLTSRCGLLGLCGAGTIANAGSGYANGTYLGVWLTGSPRITTDFLP